MIKLLSGLPVVLIFIVVSAVRSPPSLIPEADTVSPFEAVVGAVCAPEVKPKISISPLPNPPVKTIPSPQPQLEPSSSALVES